MNRTTVKRGIGAVILALVAAGLLAFLLKDKAAQRQEVVEISLPGTGISNNANNQATRLPTLTTDNSGNGNVIANAGSGNGTTANNAANLNAASSAASNTQVSNSSGSASSNNNAGTVIASAAAVGAAAVGATSGGTAGNTAKSMDFSVKPKAAATATTKSAAKASDEFLDIDLVNNGQPNPTKTPVKSTAVKVTTATAAAQKAPAAPNTLSNTNTDQGVVIASTNPRSGASAKNTVRPRLIGEKRAAPIRSANTARVITKKAPKKKAPAKKEAPAVEAKPIAQAKNGYAIQLLATSNASRANNLKKVMAGEGYPAYVTKTKHNGKMLYRVRIGQYTAKAQAVSAQAAMKRRYKKNTNVNRSAVVAR